MSVKIDNLNYNNTVNAEKKADADNQEKKSEEQKSEKSYLENGVVYEKSSKKPDNSTYSINKMSKSDREAIVRQMKEESERQQKQLVDLVKKTLSEQASTFGKASDDKLWQILSSGKFTVDAETKTQAQEDISEDGYWGVKKTSQRLFDFASALAGDDVEKMKKMQAAMEKGYKQATGTWGKELPDICKDTIDAANKLFDDYYASKEKSE